MGLRDAAVGQMFRLKRALDRVAAVVREGGSGFLVMGDFNTMGQDDPVPWSRVTDVASGVEVERLGSWASRRGMRLVPKDAAATWWNGGSSLAPADLDQVLATEALPVRSAQVLGWPREPPASRRTWIHTLSDHACVLVTLPL